MKLVWSLVILLCALTGIVGIVLRDIWVMPTWLIVTIISLPVGVPLAFAVWDVLFTEDEWDVPF